MAGLTDAIAWYKVCCDEEYIPGLEEEPEFQQDELMRLLLDDEEYLSCEAYRLDIKGSNASLQATRFEYDGQHFYNLELNTSDGPNAMLTISAEDSELIRSAHTEVMMDYIHHVLSTKGLPADYVDAFRSMFFDPQTTYVEKDDSLEYRLSG